MNCVRWRRSVSGCLSFALLAGTALWSLERSAAADDGEPAMASPTADDVSLETPGVPPLAAAASVGTFLPFSYSPSVESQRAYAISLGGYDSARKTGSFEAAAEVRVWGPISVRGGAVYSGATETMRPSFGARVQVLREGRHGVDGAVGVFYRPEGLTEPEGEIESVVSLGRHVGRTYFVGNLFYGQDPEGNERDGEVRLAAVRPLSGRLFGGFDGRLRFDLGSQASKLVAHREATLDALVGPTVAALIGPVALSLQGGGSALRLYQQKTTFGAFVLAGLGTTF